MDLYLSSSQLQDVIILRTFTFTEKYHHAAGIVQLHDTGSRWSLNSILINENFMFFYIFCPLISYSMYTLIFIFKVEK